MKNFISKCQNSFTNIVNVAPVFLSVIATITITWYLATSYDVTNNWWFSPALAGIAGFSAIIIPALSKRFKPIWSIVSTGLTILVLQLLTQFIPNYNSTTFSIVFLVILIIEIFTEFFVYKSLLPLGDIIIDTILAGLCAWLLIHCLSSLISVIILLIVYILTLKINNFHFDLYTMSKADDDSIE